MDMEKLLKDFCEVIIEEINKNEEFSNKVKKILVENIKIEKDKLKTKKKKKVLSQKDILINPYEILLEGTEVLENKISKLELQDLKNIVEYYSMDPSKSFKRWRKKERFINLILEVSILRANKGNAFR